MGSPPKSLWLIQGDFFLTNKNVKNLNEVKEHDSYKRCKSGTIRKMR